jgi:hypothetical protein
MDLAAEVPNLLPAAVTWVQRHEAHILSTGRPLSAIEQGLAKAVGVGGAIITCGWSGAAPVSRRPCSYILSRRP